MSWIKAPFNRASGYIQDVLMLVSLTRRGTMSLSKSYPLVAAVTDLAKVNGEIDEAQAQRELQFAAQERDIAQSEISKDFPLLHAHAVVSIYVALEVFTRDLVTAWILNKPEVLKTKTFGLIKINVAEYENFTKFERVEFVVNELEKALRVDFRPGVARTEAVLEALGVSGPVEPSIRDAIFEMSQVRNLIVHCASVADKRFVTNCPRFGIKVGDYLAVSSNKLREYATATLQYLTLVATRIKDLKVLEERSCTS